MFVQDVCMQCICVCARIGVTQQCMLNNMIRYTHCHIQKYILSMFSSHNQLHCYISNGIRFQNLMFGS